MADNNLTKKEKQQYFDTKLVERQKKEKINETFLLSKIFAVVVLFVICVAILRFDGNGSITNIPSFTSFLEILSSAEPLDWDFHLVFDGGDWGIFDIVRQYIQVILSVFNFVAEGVWAVLQFLYLIIKWIFLSA